MIDTTRQTSDGIGAPGTHAFELAADEHRLLAGAVRESVRRQIVSLLRRRGLDPRQAIPCPTCGERVIFLDQTQSFVFDRRAREYLCKACAAERDFTAMVHPQADIGGEGG
jgi:DNA-directed RNA polymerase subunit RPC12/RpoP